MREVLVTYLRQVSLISINLGCIVLLLSACGGGNGDSSNQQFSNFPVSTSSASISTSASSSKSSVANFSSLASSTSSISSTGSITVSGIISYDYIPHNANHVGLNYSAIEQRPVRGAVVELIDDVGQIKAVTTTGNDGSYSLSVQKNLLIKVRVKAQLLSSSAPTWDFKVTDNTSNNALYVLEGDLISVSEESVKRSLHARSGWDGAAYSAPRSAGPFAILDSIYMGVERIVAVGNRKNFTPLELRWSTKNSTADGDITKGEIGTSFYDGSAIYILGDANNDADEYDPHVLLHEWGHYIEGLLFRSDSIGGDHSDGQLLDLRVAMSEGFANAFSGMMINKVNYADAFGVAQSSGFTFSIDKKNRLNKGYFSEGSVGSILYNYYVSNVNKTANDFLPIFSILNNVRYSSSEAFTSIFLFYAQLKIQIPEHEALFSSLMQEQNIFGVDEYASEESNNGGLNINLPVYKTLIPSGAALNVCSAADYGKYNKLGNSQFLKLNITQPGIYNIHVSKSGGAEVISKPELILYQKGRDIAYIENTMNDNVTGNINIPRGNYVLEIYDLNNRTSNNTDENMTCFNVRATAS
jgi:hypothetical protein